MGNTYTFHKICNSLYKGPETPRDIKSVCVSDGWTDIKNLSGMWFLNLFLIAPAAAIPVIDTGLGPVTHGSEGSISNFAVLTDNDLGKLPTAFTICSSISTQAFVA